jgi:uncharacterized protein DUF3455
MKRSRAVIAITATTLTAGCARWGIGTMPPLPENLKAPTDELLALEAAATGVQIYECAAAKDQPTRYEWVFKAPEAELFERAGEKIGKHYAGPTWEANDGSKVVGQVKARDNGPDPSAIPWLLMTAKSTSGGGVFGRTTSIQRANTVGGIAPTEGCGEAQAGKVVRVPYTATYYFYVAKLPSSTY